jgi:hypothetical protein
MIGLNPLIVNLRATVLAICRKNRRWVTSNAQDRAGRSLDDPERVRPKATEGLVDRPPPDDHEIGLLLTRFFDHGGHDLPNAHADRKFQPRCVLDLVDVRACVFSHSFLKLAFTFEVRPVGNRTDHVQDI